jgi:hypothetical protein
MMCRLDLASYWVPSQGAKEMDLYGHTFTRQVASHRLAEIGIYSDRHLLGLPLDGNQRSHAGY